MDYQFSDCITHSPLRVPGQRRGPTHEISSEESQVCHLGEGTLQTSRHSKLEDSEERGTQRDDPVNGRP
jgi:hypothetical protein